MNIIHEGAQFGEISVQKKNLDTLEFITVLQEADAPNRNGRVYPKAVLEKALNAPNIRERLATNTWYGEANHPLDNSVQRQMTIDLRNVAFLIKEIWWEGNILKGRCETANTSVGRDMKGLIEQGCRVAFSLRAQGNVHTNPATGLVEVEDGLQILGYDWIQVPSHSKAFMEKICEATIMAMYRTTKGNLNSQILCESENLFLYGDIFDTDRVDLYEEIDYTKNYTTKLKKVSDMYVPENYDEVSLIEGKNVIIKNNSKNIIKKVLTEDYIVKDIRGKIIELMEGNKED
jgi:hypothetical protein